MLLFVGQNRTGETDACDASRHGKSAIVPVPRESCCCLYFKVSGRSDAFGIAFPSRAISTRRSGAEASTFGLATTRHIGKRYAISLLAGRPIWARPDSLGSSDWVCPFALPPFYRVRRAKTAQIIKTPRSIFASSPRFLLQYTTWHEVRTT